MTVVFMLNFLFPPIMFRIFQNCLVSKGIDEIVEEAGTNSNLQRSMNAFDLILLGIGAIVGAGIFVIAGEAASQYAGPSVAISFVLAGFMAICVGFCYAELSTIIPVSGGSYSYMYASIGELPAFIVGYILVLGNCFIIGTVAHGWAEYFASLMGNFGIVVNHVYAMNIFLVIIGGLLYFSVNSTAIVNTIMVFLKMGVLSLFVIIGVFYINYDNFVPFIPEHVEGTRFGGLIGIFSATPILFFAFNGFETVALAAQEVKNPQKNLPIGLILSIAISTIFYIAISLVLTGVVDYHNLNCAKPIAVAIEKIGIEWLSVLANFGAVCGLSTVIIAMAYGAGRIIFAMTGDGLLPGVLRKCSKHGTPYVATTIVMCTGMALAMWFNLSKLSNLSSVAIIINLMSVCIVALYMRFKHPNIERVFKAPALNIIGPVCIAFFVYFLQTMHIGIEFMYVIVAGLAIYFAYGRRNSILMKNLSEKGAKSA